MAPMFASPDIAALVAAFPPPLPTKERPSLVRSNSGANLLDSRKVLANFRLLLQNGSRRMRKAELLSQLEIQDLDWLCECLEGEVCWSADLGSVVPEGEVRVLRDRVTRRVEGEFAGIEDLGTEIDVARQSLERILERVDGLRRFEIGGGREVVGTVTLVERMKEEILSPIGASDGDKVDLSSAQPGIPSAILLELSQELLERQGEGGGAANEDGRVIYTPSNYHTLQESKQKELYESQIATLCNDLATDGYCEVDAGPAELTSGKSGGTEEPEALTQDVQTVFAKKHEDVELKTFDQYAQKVPSRSRIIIKKSILDETMTELEAIIKSGVKMARGTAHIAAPRQRLDKWLCDETSRLGVTQRLLRSSEHRRSLEDILQVTANAANDAERKRFLSDSQGSLLCPLELYRQGLGVIADPTLKQRLDQYICEHFRQDVLPALVRSFGETAVTQDKARSKDLETLSAACSQANTVNDIHSSAVKFCRKQKIALPDSDQLGKARGKILLEKLKGMQDMSRGSDILQNLIWILLSQATGGLFISAGKDTSRMIKQYQAVGDVEKGWKLEEWRDVLKAGKQSDGDLLQMKAMAGDVVEGMHG